MECLHFVGGLRWLVRSCVVLLSILSLRFMRLCAALYYIGCVRMESKILFLLEVDSIF